MTQQANDGYFSEKDHLFSSTAFFGRKSQRNRRSQILGDDDERIATFNQLILSSVHQAVIRTSKAKLFILYCNFINLFTLQLKHKLQLVQPSISMADNSAPNDNDKNGGGDENHPDNKKLTGENWTSLRDKPRGCTDCLCVVSKCTTSVFTLYITTTCVTDPFLMTCACCSFDNYTHTATLFCDHVCHDNVGVRGDGGH